MTIFLIIFIAVAGMLGAGQVRADAGAFRALEAEQEQLSLAQDSLEVERLGLVQDADSLSACIDSFKAEAADSEELQEALRASLVLEQRLVEIGQQLETLEVEREALRERLRLAYDWEIGVLIQQLSRKPEKGLVQQLMIYQEAREALGEKAAATGMRYGENMDISPEDSPNQISQKVELMEDIAARLQAEARETTEKLNRLEEEHRLRARVQIFTTEIRLFDEHLPEGRVLVRVEKAVDPAEGLRSGQEGVTLDEPPPGFDAGLAGPTTQEVLVARSELSREAHSSVEELAADDLILEIHKLKARQQEIHQLEAVARERAEAFRKYLRKLLEGGE